MNDNYSAILLRRMRRVALFFMFIAALLGYRLHFLMQPSSNELKPDLSVTAVDGSFADPILPYEVLLDRNYRPLGELKQVCHPVLSTDLTPQEICHRLGRTYYSEEWLAIGSNLYWSSELSEREWNLLFNDLSLRVQPLYLAEPLQLRAEHLAGAGGAGIDNSEAASRWQGMLWNLLDPQSTTTSASATLLTITTLQEDMQLVVESIAAEKIDRGGILVLETTGEIVALASRPSVFSLGQEAPFLNRVFACYPPGSLFKMLVAGLALNEEVITGESLFYCPGYYELPDRLLGCTGVHGWVNLKEAISVSCNAAFAEIGTRLGYDALYRGIRLLGLNSSHGMPLLDFPDHVEYALPTTVLPGELVNLSIGQGQLLATPLDMGLLYCGIANGGVMPRAKLVQGWISSGSVLRPFSNAAPDDSGEVRLWSKETNSLLLSALKQTVESGTGIYAASDEISIAGKSGTAELGDGQTNHAWFAAMAPAEAPRYIVIVFIEKGQWGGSVAGPIAKEVLQEIFRITPK